MPALDRAQGLQDRARAGSDDPSLLALAYCMLTFGEMLKQSTRGSVNATYAGPIALRDKLTHLPHRKLNVRVLTSSVDEAMATVRPVVVARIADLDGRADGHEGAGH